VSLQENGLVRAAVLALLMVLTIVYTPVGYGATTLPALTEAITIEGNVTLAEYETGRLTGLITKLTDQLRT
jgi:hypothetical protein